MLTISRPHRDGIKNTMTNAFFHNFTDEVFTGFWNGKPKTFKPGERVLMPAWLAEHFAKHLTNRELIKANKEVYTSPKQPGQVPEFMAVFRKCFIPEGKEATANSNELDEIISSAQVPSMDIVVTKPTPIDQGAAAALEAENNERSDGGQEEVDPYDARNAPLVGPGNESTVLNGPEDDDESGFEHKQ